MDKIEKKNLNDMNIQEKDYFSENLSIGKVLNILFLITKQV